jgi:hypothetical protein
VSTGRALGAQLARSLALSALAGSASVLAHLVVVQHLPPPRVVLVVAGVLLLADLTAGTVLRGRAGTAVRVLGLQVGAHVLLVVGTVAAGSGAAVTAGHHATAVDAGAVDSAAGLLPSWPMLAAHLLVALVVAALVSATEAAGRGALDLPALARAAAGALARLLPGPAAPPYAPAPRVHRGAGPAAPARPHGVWARPAPVRRGPPAPAGA